MSGRTNQRFIQQHCHTLKKTYHSNQLPCSTKSHHMKITHHFEMPVRLEGRGTHVAACSWRYLVETFVSPWRPRLDATESDGLESHDLKIPPACAAWTQTSRSLPLQSPATHTARCRVRYCSCSRREGNTYLRRLCASLRENNFKKIRQHNQTRKKKTSPNQHLSPAHCFRGVEASYPIP